MFQEDFEIIIVQFKMVNQSVEHSKMVAGQLVYKIVHVFQAIGLALQLGSVQKLTVGVKGHEWVWQISERSQFYSVILAIIFC